MSESTEAMDGKIWVVGLGPGDASLLTPAARCALERSDVVVGYTTYVRLISDLIEGKELVRQGMRREVERAHAAVERARAGHQVAVISSGDSGIYGMAGLVYEVLMADGWRPGDSPEIEVVPGVPAVVAAASLLGAPLMHDFAVISLSDLLTPRDVVMHRLEAAAEADFVIALYNPRSHKRTEPFHDALRVLGWHRPPETAVGIVRSAFRDGQSVRVTTLAEVKEEEIDMLSLMIIGNADTRRLDGLMVTPRGYGKKYRLAMDEIEMPTAEGDRVADHD